MSAIARAVLATAPHRFALCGLSMGGYIAFEMVRQAPDRIERLSDGGKLAKLNRAKCVRSRV